MEIVNHSESIGRDVVDLIIGIQRTEFGLDTHSIGQPDLLNVADFYQSGCGGFWVAIHDGVVVGTLGLRDIGDRQAALRRMYVKATHRGREHAVAACLLERLVQSATQSGVKEVYLATAEMFVAAHRFYEKNAFAQVGLESLPSAFPRIPEETRFYCRRL